MKEEKRRREMSTGSRENKQGSTGEKTNTGNRGGGGGRRPRVSWALSLHCPTTDPDSTTTTSTSVKPTAQGTSLTGQTPALPSKRSTHTARDTFLSPSCTNERESRKQASPLPFLAPKQLAACGPVLLATLGGASW